MVVTKKRKCCLFQYLSFGNNNNDNDIDNDIDNGNDNSNNKVKKKDLFMSPCAQNNSFVNKFISSDEFSINSDEESIEYNDFYLDVCKIIGSSNYFKNGIVIDDTGNDYEKNWYICSTIKFQTQLNDKLILWKHIEGDIWDEKILSVKEILQLNGI